MSWETMSKKRTTQNAFIRHKIRETKDTVTLRLKLSKPFTWDPGQFIMVRAVIDGKSVRRAYSISSSPTRQDYLDITIRQTEDPTMSKYLNDIEEESYLEVRGPYGRFIWKESVSDKVFLLGAGSGITPLKGIMEYIADKKLDNPVKLLYSCGHGDNVIFDDRLEELDNEIKNSYYELSLTREPDDKYPEIRKGRINLAYLEKEIKGFEGANFYICGSPGFVKAMMKYLDELDIDEEKVNREQWG